MRPRASSSTPCIASSSPSRWSCTESHGASARVRHDGPHRGRLMSLTGRRGLGGSAARDYYEPRGGRCRRSPTRARATTRDEIWLTEHAPIYTLGLAGRRGAPAARQRHPGAQGRSRRPGDLPRARAARRLSAVRSSPRAARRARSMVRRIETARDRHGSRLRRDRGLRQAVGARVSTSCATAARRRSPRSDCKVRNGCTYHGFALNVDMDLAPFARHRPLRLSRARGDAARRPRRRAHASSRPARELAPLARRR